METAAGGYGPASERAPARVLDALRDGKISAAEARESYAVVIDAGGTAVAAEASAALRAGMTGG